MQPRGAHVDMRGLHGPGRLHCGSSWHSWESASLGVETRKGRGGLTRNSDRRKGLEAQVKGKLVPGPSTMVVLVEAVFLEQQVLSTGAQVLSPLRR